MSTRKDKRAEARGNGQYVFSSDENKETILIFVEREPDNLMAAAICTKELKNTYNVILQFTDRHSINYDLTKYSIEIQCNRILILCPSINEYSVIFLNRINIPYQYYGSSTKLKPEYVNENILLTTQSITKRMCEKYNYSGKIFDEIEAYTTRFFPRNMGLYEGIRYQYLCFRKKAKELFILFLEHLEMGRYQLELDEATDREYRGVFEKQMALIETQIEKGMIREHRGLKFIFLHGGCPCTLLLNAAIRSKNVDVCVNSCMHRQHFTVLCEKGMRDIFDEYVNNFIYSGCGEYSGGGCFEKDCNDERFIASFFEKRSIHGFYKDRLGQYNDFDPEEYEWIECTNGLTNKLVYKNFNFTIFIDSYCNADCRFCVEQIKTKNTGCIEKHRLDDKEKYLEQLDVALSKVRELNPSISITGGEPVLCPWFGEVLKLLKKYRFRKTVITTNGSGILSHVDEIIDAGISHVNFSRPHFKPDIVQDIMRFKEEKYADYFEELRQAIERLEAGGVRTRFNCILTKNGINSVELMKTYMDYVISLGCHHVVFRELMSFNEETSLNEEKKKYASENRVFINELWKQIDADKAFRYSMNMQGHYYYIEIYEYRNLTMVSERANLKSLEDNYEKNKDYIYEMVFHPNGNLCAGWTEDKDVILDF